MEPIDHPVSRYALGVLEGDIVAGDLVRMACERHLMDLETGADRGLFFDCQAASRIINWASMLQHTTGPMAGQPLKLEPWQEFRHGSVFGWKRSETGLRRFQSTYHQVGKKNGKTTDTAVPMLFTQLWDGEAAPQGYCAATTKNQAGLLFKEMKRMTNPQSDGIPVLGPDDDIKSLDLTAADQELLASRKFDREQLATIYRMPPSKLQMLENGVKANGEQQAIDYLTDCLLHWSGLAEQTLAMSVLTRGERDGGMFLRHDFGALLQPTIKDQIEAVTKAVGGPIYTPDEGRKKVGLPPTPGGDKMNPAGC